MTTNTKIRIAVAAAAGLVLLVLVMFGALSGQQPDPGAASAPSTATAGSTPAAAPAESVQEHGDDGPSDVEASASASPATIDAGPAQPKEAAIQFMVKYLNTQGKTAAQWRAGFRPLVTPELAAELADVEPQRVPVGQVADSKVTAKLVGDALELVTVPLVVGVQEQVVANVKVTLTGRSGRWLVSDLDVEPA